MEILGKNIVTVINHLLNFAIAFYVARKIVLAIKDADGNIFDVKSRKRREKNPFGDDADEEIRQIQHSSLNQKILILAAVWPVLFLSAIYVYVPEPIYHILNTYSVQSGLGIIGVYSSAFMVGLCFARSFLVMPINNQDNELYEAKSKMIIEERVDNIGVTYLSFTFCVILFSYIGFDFKINTIKAITTFFLCGNIFYLVFRQNLQMSDKYLNFFRKNSNSSTSGLGENDDVGST